MHWSCIASNKNQLSTTFPCLRLEKIFNSQKVGPFSTALTNQLCNPWPRICSFLCCNAGGFAKTPTDHSALKHVVVKENKQIPLYLTQRILAMMLHVCLKSEFVPVEDFQGLVSLVVSASFPVKGPGIS